MDALLIRHSQSSCHLPRWGRLGSCVSVYNQVKSTLDYISEQTKKPSPAGKVDLPQAKTDEESIDKSTFFD